MSVSPYGFGTLDLSFSMALRKAGGMAHRLNGCLKVLWMFFVGSVLGDWPQAAGPAGNFQVPGQAPTQFSVALDQGVLWRTSLPSTGQGTPIVSCGKVFVTSHEVIEADTEMGHDLIALCLDASNGREIWRRTVPGVRHTDLSSLFSDNTAASPVADGERVCFVNVGGAIRCFDFQGKTLWSYDWVPFGRHHARLHEPILHEGKVITVQYPDQDLLPEHTTKPGAAPLGRAPKYWTRLMAFDLATGNRDWVSPIGTSIHQTSLLGQLPGKGMAILTGRGGGHQPPEEPYGLSLVDASNGKAIWTLDWPKYPSAQNACWNGKIAGAFVPDGHLTIDARTGQVLLETSLTRDVTLYRHEGETWVLEEHQNLPPANRPITKNSNLLVGPWHYFRSDRGYRIGRVQVHTGKVEYLDVPVQVVRRKGEPEVRLWNEALKNDMRNADEFLATQDKRNAGDGWGHVSAASPIVVGDYLYIPTMIGMVYVLRWNVDTLTPEALVSISDLGPATQTWTLSSLAYDKGRLYARTLKELICIGSGE